MNLENLPKYCEKLVDCLNTIATYEKLSGGDNIYVMDFEYDWKIKKVLSGPIVVIPKNVGPNTPPYTSFSKINLTIQKIDINKFIEDIKEFKVIVHGHNNSKNSQVLIQFLDQEKFIGFYQYCKKLNLY